MDKDKKEFYISKGLDKINPNHLKLKSQDLFFEVHGGVNPESFQSLRVMLIVRYDRTTIREQIDLYNSYILTTFTKKIAEKTGFTAKYVETSLGELIGELETYKMDLLDSKKKNHRPAFEIEQQDEVEALTFLKDQKLLSRTNELIGEAGVIGNDKNRLLLFLIYLSRKQDKPLHAIIQSNYNYLQTKVGELIPNEDKLLISHLSDNAIFYFDDDELSNKLLLVEDTGTNKVKLLPLFDLQAKGYLTKTVTQKDEDGYLRTIQREVYGPICLSVSTPNEQAFNNNSVLSFILSEDNSTKQDDLIMDYQRRQSAGLVNKYEEQKTKKFLWNIQRMIKPIRVINPFAQQIRLPNEMVNKQITNSHYLSFIELVTLFKQHQKTEKVFEQTGETYIETSLEDIKEANDLLSEILLKKCDTLNTPTRLFFEKMKSHLAKNTKKTFTNQELHLALNVPIATVKRYTSSLQTEGFIQLTGDGNRAIGFEYKLINESDYTQLQESLKNTLNSAITSIQKAVKGSPKSEVAQNESEPPKAKTTKALSKVAQNSVGAYGGRGSKSANSNSVAL
jgi:predicted transcriptional regulator